MYYYLDGCFQRFSDVAGLVSDGVHWLFEGIPADMNYVLM